MYFLAQALAKNRPIISDSPKFQALAYAPPDLGLNRRGVDVDKGFMLAVASFETVHPLGIEHVPVSKLIKFREDHQEERTRFHLEVGRVGERANTLRCDPLSPRRTGQADFPASGSPENVSPQAFTGSYTAASIYKLTSPSRWICS